MRGLELMVYNYYFLYNINQGGFVSFNNNRNFILLNDAKQDNCINSHKVYLEEFDAFEKIKDEAINELFVLSRGLGYTSICDFHKDHIWVRGFIDDADYIYFDWLNVAWPELLEEELFKQETLYGSL